MSPSSNEPQADARQAPRASRRPTDAGSEPAAHRGGPAVARKFVGRVAQLDLTAVRAAVSTWHDLMCEHSATWFAAEEAVGEAVVTSGRHAEQHPLLIDIAEAVADGVWYGATARSAHAAPERRVGATEATGQYLTTVAMLALLVRDHLEPPTFELLYRPFTALIPQAELAAE